MSQRTEDKELILELEGTGSSCPKHKKYNGKRRPTIFYFATYIYLLTLAQYYASIHLARRNIAGGMGSSSPGVRFPINQGR